MISIETQMDGALLEMELSGEITSADYGNRLVPAFEGALAKHERVRAVIVAGDEFRGFDMGAVWADTKLGLSHWSGFDRLAVVTDARWLATAIRVAAMALPCPVQVFPLAEAENARRWIRESLGSVHMIDLGGPCLQVRLMGRLDPEVIANAEGDLNARIRERDGFRLLLDLTDFDGWQAVSALGAHFSLVREHAGLPERVAVVGDRGWQQVAQRIMGRFQNAETRFFGSEDLEAAKSWLSDG